MSAEHVKPGMVIAGRYRVERQLGEGGMGAVFLVHHVHTDERLALKVLHKAIVAEEVAKERFQREARTPARIDSDHVVRVTDADVAPELDGAPFLVMEYLRGQDLEQVVAERGQLARADVVLYLRQAARALDKAHALGIIHRDLKPENLFLTEREDGTPWIKVLDFGIAKLTRDTDVARQTATGQIFGTPLFMSPEQALAESAKISPQTDVWALGLIAQKLLTGKDLWTAENLTLLVGQIAFKPMPVPSELGGKFGPTYDAWFARCCAREVADRYGSAGEAVSALAEALGLADDDTKTLRAPIEQAKDAVTLGLAQTVQGARQESEPGAPQESELGAPQESELKSTAGPLTRSGPSIAAAPPRRRVQLIAAAVGIVGASAIATWIVTAGRSHDDTTPTASSALPEQSAPVVAAPPTSAAELPVAPPLASLPPTASASAQVTLPPKPEQRPPKAPGTARPATSASAAPSAAPTAAPSTTPSAAPRASAVPSATSTTASPKTPSSSAPAKP